MVTNSYETRHQTARLLLLRHGESTWNARALWQGQANPPLSEKGQAQAQAAAEGLIGLDIAKVISSDLVRAIRTGQIIADHLGLGEVTIEEGFREVDVGEWSGLTRVEIEQRWPGQRAAWADNKLESTPGGELLSLFTDRICEAMVRAAHLAGAAPAVIVGHSRVLSALERVVDAKPARPTHLAGRWFEVDSAGHLSGGAAVNLLSEFRGVTT